MRTVWPFQGWSPLKPHGNFTQQRSCYRYKLLLTQSFSKKCFESLGAQWKNLHFTTVSHQRRDVERKMALCGSMPLPILGPLGQNCLTTHLGSQGPTEAIIAPIPSSGSYKPNTLWEMIWSCRECLDIYQHGHLREYSQTTYFDSILVAAMSWFRVDDIFYMFSKFVHEKSGSSESTRKHTQSLEQRVQVRSWFLNPYQTKLYRQMVRSWFPPQEDAVSGWIDHPRVVAAVWQKACPWAIKVQIRAQQWGDWQILTC